MPSAKTNYLIRRTHRLLGVCIGIQFLAWTIGGLYFSWSDMDEVHGDYELSHAMEMPLDSNIVSPSVLLDSIKMLSGTDSIMDLRLIEILSEPVWQVTYMLQDTPGHAHKYLLFDAASGTVRSPVTAKEAAGIAIDRYLGDGKVSNVELITDLSAHHEYREQPLPAYAVSFDDKRRTTIYVASELGVITKIRNKPWRQFDFLWMMHTMDYESRDNITNWLLRGFSIFGLITVISGLTLFFVSYRRRA